MTNTTDTTDTKVLELFAKVRAKQKAIKTDENLKFLTNCSFSTTPEISLSRVNLHAVQSQDDLVEFYTFLLLKESFSALVAKELEIEVDSRHMGFPISSWKNDIKNRVKQLKLIKEKKDLKTLETRLDALVSPEQRREMELEAISKELGA